MIVVLKNQTGTYLTAGTDKILRWDLKLKSPVEIISGINFTNCHIHGFQNNNKYFLLSNYYKPEFSVLDFREQKEIATIPVSNNYSPSKTKYDNKNNLILFGDIPENLIKVYSLEQNCLISTRLMLESDRIDNLTLLDSGYFISHSVNSDHLKVWKSGDWMLHTRLPLRINSEINNILFTSNEKELLVIYTAGVIDVYDWFGI